MIIRTSTPRGHRLAILATVFGLHVILLALFLQQRSARVPTTESTAIGLIAIAALPPAASTPPPIPLPTKIASTSEPRPVSVSVAPSTSVEATTGAAGACSTLADVGTALLADPVVLDAIRRAPPETRSLADAVVVWNADWVEAAATPEAPLGPVRDLVQNALLASEDRCLDEALAGPRLMAIPNGDRTMFLVFGSGNWTWRQLVTPAPALVDGRPVAPIVPPTR